MASHVETELKDFLHFLVQVTIFFLFELKFPQNPLFLEKDGQTFST